MKIYFFSKIKFRIIPILIFTLFFFSCTTVKTSYVDKETIPKYNEGGGVVKIAGVFLKSGEFIELRNKNAKFVGADEIPKGISYSENINDKTYIPIDNVSLLKIDVSSNNYWVPVGIIAGLTVAFFVALIIFFSYGHFDAVGG